MKETTLCYIERDNKYLMLYRNKSKADPNNGKWLGIGGKLKQGETPDEAAIREVYEETGLILNDYQYRGAITFISDIYDDEVMHLYYSNVFKGDIHECDEGHLEWIDKDRIFDLNMWEGDRIFLKLLWNDAPFFNLTLIYDKNDNLISGNLNGAELDLANIQ
ncbi:MAG: 8-oxo-dGTP diphosphatase [Eubacteriales bacterium]|nr:8-oxo-dGTP diphosphatase [Eubacteriales bacterium]